MTDRILPFFSLESNCSWGRATLPDFFLLNSDLFLLECLLLEPPSIVVAVMAGAWPLGFDPLPPRIHRRGPPGIHLKGVHQRHRSLVRGIRAGTVVAQDSLVPFPGPRPPFLRVFRPFPPWQEVHKNIQRYAQPKLTPRSPLQIPLSAGWFSIFYHKRFDW